MKNEQSQQKRQYQLKKPHWVEDTLVKPYKKIEDSVTTTYKKIEEKFVDTFLEEKK